MKIDPYFFNFISRKLAVFALSVLILFSPHQAFSGGWLEAPKPKEPRGKINTQNPTFKWKMVKKAESYEISIFRKKEEIFNQIIAKDSVDCSHENKKRKFCIVSNLVNLPDGKYKWRIRAHNKYEISRWKGFKKFKVNVTGGEVGGIEGVDSDQDGIRDDVQEYIEETYASSEQISAARQVTQVLQDFILVTNKEDALMIIDRMNSAIDCLEARFPNTWENVSREIHDRVINNFDRLEAEVVSSGFANGEVFTISNNTDLEISCEI